jgi:serine/threonine protein kinase
MRSHIKHYQLLKELGGGGFAQVFLAFDEQLHREVAIKVLHPNLSEHSDYRRFFEREARIVASLEQLAVVPIYDFGEIEGQLYLVMRLMRGGTLADRLFEAKKALPLAEVIALLERLAPTFDAMHERGVIHRDLKPANILYDEGGSPYIADFGIARMQQATSPFTQTGISFGTPQYSSPEQITGEGTFDHRSDIYSLGIILYQLLTTEYPYWADAPLGWVYKHTEAPIPDIRAVNRHLPVGVTGVIQRMLAKQAEARYESVTAVLEDLKRAERGLLVTESPTLPGTAPLRADALAEASKYSTASPAPATPAPSTSMGLVTMGLMAIALLMILTLGVVGFVVWQNRDTNNDPVITIQPTEQPTEQPIEPEVIVTESPIPTIAPDSTQTAPVIVRSTPDATATAQQQIIEVATAQAVSVYQQLPDGLLSRGALFVPFAATVPQLDGDVSEWATPYFANVSHIAFGIENAQTPQDLSGSCAAQWTFDALYIACLIRDDQIVQLSSGNQLYEGDGLELHFDTQLTDDVERAEMDGDDYQIGVFPGDIVGRTSEAYRWFPLDNEGLLPSVRMASQRSADGYVFETEIPWSEVGMNPQPNGIYGFSLVINDTDTPETTQQESQLTLFESHQWATPPTWGLLVLLNPS